MMWTPDPRASNKPYRLFDDALAVRDARNSAAAVCENPCLLARESESEDSLWSQLFRKACEVHEELDRQLDALVRAMDSILYPESQAG